MKKLLFIFFIAPSLLGLAQNFEYQLTFEGIGDNREFFSNIATPQTILGSRGAFEVGVEVDNQRIRGGLSKLIEFGSEMDHWPTKLILYYQYKDAHNEFLMGSFPRRDRIKFPLAMITDTLMYFRPNMEGLYTEAKWDWGKQNIFADWMSRQTDSLRENFMVGFSGEIFYRIFFIENYYLMFHDAGPAIDIPGDHIKDYLGYAIRAGIRTPDGFVFTGYAKAGILSSYFRERNVTDGFIGAQSFFAEIFGKYKNFGIKSTLQSGQGQRFKYGDRFYHADNYLRTDLQWYFLNHKNLKGMFNWSLHYMNWNDLDHQQQISIVYTFGNAIPIPKHVD